MMFWKRAIPPEADPARLAMIGAQVRSRLLEDPRACPLGGAKADLFTIPGFASAQTCRALIAAIERDARPSTLFGDGGGGSDLRTSSTHYFHAEDRLAARLGAEIDALLGLPRSRAEPLQGQRYRVGEQYRHHSDHFRIDRPHWQRERLRGGQRSWTAMIYLDSVENGGATDFPRLNLSIAPEPGLLVAWNNMDRRGRPNPALLHSGLPVGAGAKFVITQWYRLDQWVQLG